MNKKQGGCAIAFLLIAALYTGCFAFRKDEKAVNRLLKLSGEELKQAVEEVKTKAAKLNQEKPNGKQRLSEEWNDGAQSDTKEDDDLAEYLPPANPTLGQWIEAAEKAAAEKAATAAATPATEKAAAAAKNAAEAPTAALKEDAISFLKEHDLQCAAQAESTKSGVGLLVVRFKKDQKNQVSLVWTRGAYLSGVSVSGAGEYKDNREHNVVGKDCWQEFGLDDLTVEGEDIVLTVPPDGECDKSAGDKQNKIKVVKGDWNSIKLIWQDEELKACQWIE